jgi:hypothetical protein
MSIRHSYVCCVCIVVYSKSARGVFCVGAAVVSCRPALLGSHTLQPGYAVARDVSRDPQTPVAACLCTFRDVCTLTCHAHVFCMHSCVCVCRVAAAPWHNWPWLTVPAFPAPQPCHRRCRCCRIRAPPCSALSLWRWATAQTRQQARCARTDQTGNHCLRAARPLASVHCGVAGSLPLWRLSVSVRSAYPLPVCKYCWLRTRTRVTGH